MSYTQAGALLNRGPSRPTLFKVRLPDRKVSRGLNDYLEFFCSATAIPEVRSNTVAVAGHENMGIVREQPTAIMFGKPFVIEVIADPDYRSYMEMRAWFNETAVNANQSGGIGRAQRMRYYNTFTENMELIKLEQGGFGQTYREVMKVDFINAYPIQIDAINLDTSQTDSFVKYRVAFTYESYSVTSGGNSIVDGISSILNNFL